MKDELGNKEVQDIFEESTEEETDTDSDRIAKNIDAGLEHIIKAMPEETFTPEEQEERSRRNQEWECRKRRKRRKRRGKVVLAILLEIGILGGVVYGGYHFVTEKQRQAELSIQRKAEQEALEQAKKQEKEEQAAQEAARREAERLAEEEALRAEVQAVISQADLLAAQYDYDSAIELLKKSPQFDRSREMQEAAAGYENTKSTCVSWPLEEVTHVFYHTLIKDTSKAFDGDYKEGDYNQVMTTIDEFNKITQTMYERGYVMVSIYDMAKVNEEGAVTRGEILLPPGKIPFVLSQDDVSYYHYMEGDGYASRLIVDEEGKVRNEYVEEDGSISVGDYDMVPLIDRFVEQHPDFSYRGAKGIIALTGYNGVLGYRTDISYQERPADLDANKVQWLEAHPEFDLETERQQATKVAGVMKENGWLFASHTWGHQNVGEASLKKLKKDTRKFKENVDPIIGGTDIIIFAFGTDLTDFEDYSGEKFEFFKSQGYHYFCNVDSSRYFVQIRDRYFRQGRRNLDGYRMYHHPELVEDLFSASEVFSAERPVPVPSMG